MSRDLELDIDTHDLKRRNFDFTIIDGDAQVRQRIKIKLKLFLREWFLDQTAGVPYFDSVLVKNPNVNLITSILRAAIAEVPEVNEVEEIEVDLDEVTRKLSVSFRVLLNNGSEVIETQFDLPS